MDQKDNKNDDILDEIEERLVREERESKKEEMSVSGKSVFEIKRMKERKRNGLDKSK